ncbi:MAG: trypsin-like peptidase domain-containing protein [Candidatus Aureabacteria bacterium]|nr:trypsin-like peptidase domain-containing protein [Candidatus Auribacterota bacterium]
MKTSISVFGLTVLLAAFPARGGPALEALEKEIGEIIDRSAPAVVSVITEPLPENWPGFPEEMQPPVWARRFFRGGYVFQKRRCRGSGFVIDPSGYVLTTETVVDGAHEVEVSFPDGNSLPARVLGKDPRCNLALLKVEGVNLPYLPLGRPAAPTRGSWVIAIGNPFGLAVSPSWGIVSGLKRSGLDTAEYEELIQITAPINPGDSGGPLLNSRGEVIGIVTATLSGYREFEFDWRFLRRFQSLFPGDTGEYPGDVFQPSLAQGIGFAIPVDLAREVADTLKREPSPAHGWLGIRMRALSPAEARERGVRGGVMVEEALPGSPAARAGLANGDVIISLDKKEMVSPPDLQREVMILAAGKEIVLEVLRGKETLAMLATLSSPPSGMTLKTHGAFTEQTGRE